MNLTATLKAFSPRVSTCGPEYLDSSSKRLRLVCMAVFGQKHRITLAKLYYPGASG